MDSTANEDLLVLAEVLGDVKARTDKLESEMFCQTRPLEAAIAGIKALKYHVLDNNLGALSIRVDEQRKTITERMEAVVSELSAVDKTNLVASEERANNLRTEVEALHLQLTQLSADYAGNVERLQREAEVLRGEVQRVEALAKIPGPPGVGMRAAGPWDPERSGQYMRGDVVSYLGASYLSAVDENEEKPGPKAKKWTQLVGRPHSYSTGPTEGGGGTSFVSAPATATSSGTAGQIAYTAFHFYVCTATNTWRRCAIGAW